MSGVMKFFSVLMGIFMIGLSVYYFNRPGQSWLLAGIFVVIYFLFASIMDFVKYSDEKQETGNKKWSLIVLGVLGVILSIYLLTKPVLASVTAMYALAFYLIFASGFQVYLTMKNKENVRFWGLYLFLGILTFILGFAMLFNPILGATTVYVFVWIELLFLGIKLIVAPFAIGKA